MFFTKYLHVTEYPSECVAYLITAIKGGTLMDDKAKALECLFTILAFAANWVSGLDDGDPVIGSEVSDLEPEQQEQMVDLLTVAEVDIPAGGPIANIILAQVVALAMKYVREMLEDPEALKEMIEKFFLSIFEDEA